MTGRMMSLLVILTLPFLICCSLAEKGTHNAGKNCTWAGCHGYQAPAWQYSGTVFTSPDRSAPAQGVTVTITDSMGVRALKTNAVGNFYTLAGEPSAGYRAEISRRGETRVMGFEATSGACNSFHSPDGTAPPLHVDGK
jgi:hypothetical protein